MQRAILATLAALALVACGGGQSYESGGKYDPNTAGGPGGEPSLSTVNLPPPPAHPGGGEGGDETTPGQTQPGEGGAVADGSQPGETGQSNGGEHPSDGSASDPEGDSATPGRGQQDPTTEGGGEDGSESGGEGGAEAGGEGGDDPSAHPSPAGYDGVTPPPRAPQADPLCPYGAARAQISCERACALAETCGETGEDCIEACELNIRAFSAAGIEQLEECLEDMACEEGEEDGSEESFDLMGACLAASGYPLPLEVAVVCHDLERHALGCGADLSEVEALRGVCLTLSPNLHKDALSKLVSCAGVACSDRADCMSHATCSELSGLELP
jgi:hypothetical protein